jgi:hypothetical protein
MAGPGAATAPPVAAASVVIVGGPRPSSSGRPKSWIRRSEASPFSKPLTIASAVRVSPTSRPIAGSRVG